MGAVSRYVGLLAATMSRLDDAARLLDAAADRNAAIDARPWVAHARADHARVLLAREAPGDREHTAEILLEARAIHERLGMTASAQRVAALLAETEPDAAKAPR